MLGMLMLLFTVLFLPAGGSSDVDTWAVYDGKGFMHISGSSEDFRKVGELKHTMRKPFLYARRGRTAWLIDDPATVAVVRAICNEPTALEMRRRELDRSRREAEMAALALQRRASHHYVALAGDEESDDDRDGKERDEETLERAIEEKEARLDELEYDLDLEYDAWQDRVDREVARVVSRAIADGLAKKLR